MKTKSKKMKAMKAPKIGKKSKKLLKKYPEGSEHHIDQMKGLGPKKYVVTKTDGTTVNPSAQYFVLRLDKNGHDPIWAKCCRRAALTLARELKRERHLLVMAKELKQLVSKIKKHRKG